MQVHEAASLPRTSPAAVKSPVLLLRIDRGQTRFPNRPVLTDRYLIGAAPTCDLRLTGADIPPLHSVIARDGGAYRWETMMSRPAVRHNGRICESFIVSEGDQITIGGVRFAVHMGELAEFAHELGVDPLTTTLNSPVQGSAGLEDFSAIPAPELVDRLEQDLEWIDRFESRRQLGAEALLDAVQRKRTGVKAASPKEDQLVDRLEQLAAQLSRCTSALERRAEEIATDHRDLSATLCDVLDAEARLADRLESILNGVAATAEGASRTAA